MKLKIISDGTSKGTKVYNEYGEDVSQYVQTIVWKVSAWDEPSATIQLVFTEAEIDVNIEKVFFTPSD